MFSFIFILVLVILVNLFISVYCHDKISNFLFNYFLFFSIIFFSFIFQFYKTFFFFMDLFLVNNKIPGFVFQMWTIIMQTINLVSSII